MEIDDGILRHDFSDTRQDPFPLKMYVIYLSVQFHLKFQLLQLGQWATDLLNQSFTI